MSVHYARVIDSHSAGEPTRVVIEGGPDLGEGPIARRRDRFLAEHDHWRRGLVLEPRGSQALVGALLLPPEDRSCDAAVIFFNNVGGLGMCGHGVMGVVETLRHLGRLSSPQVRLETPVGVVHATVQADGCVAVRNVAAVCSQREVAINVAGYGQVTGDVAWGGNWFFLSPFDSTRLIVSEVAALTTYALAIQQTLRAQKISGRDGAIIDHIELCGAAHDRQNHGRNFVLCPGGAYDRSPCGTGTSAKMACLHARGELALEQLWRQESVIGSVFTGWLTQEGSDLVPTIAGRAHVIAQSELIFAADDPFCWGLQP